MNQLLYVLIHIKNIFHMPHNLIIILIIIILRVEKPDKFVYLYIIVGIPIIL